MRPAATSPVNEGQTAYSSSQVITPSPMSSLSKLQAPSQLKIMQVKVNALLHTGTRKKPPPTCSTNPNAMSVAQRAKEFAGV